LDKSCFVSVRRKCLRIFNDTLTTRMHGALPPSNTLLLHKEHTVFTHVSMKVKYSRQDVRSIPVRWFLFVSVRSVNTERRERSCLPDRPHVSTRNTDGQILTKFDTGSLTENCSAICVCINVNEQQNINPGFWRFADRASQYLTNLMHKNVFYNKFYFMPLHVFEHMCSPPDDEHMCSKHVEAWNKTYCKTHFVHQVCSILR